MAHDRWRALGRKQKLMPERVMQEINQVAAGFKRRLIPLEVSKACVKYCQHRQHTRVSLPPILKSRTLRDTCLEHRAQLVTNALPVASL